VALGATLQAGFGLESDDGGLVGSGSPGQWEWGEVVSGPQRGFSGTRAWATVLDGPHLNNALDMLAFPQAPLSQLADPMMICWIWVDLEAGDYAWLEAKTGGAWTPVEPVYGYANPAGFTGHVQSWAPVAVDLVGLSDLSQLRIVFLSDSSVSGAGVYLDDISLWDGDVAAPLLESLTVLQDTENLAGPYPVTVNAQDNLQLSYVDLLYSVDNGPEQVVVMTPSAGTAHTGLIPGQGHDTTVTYRVEASDGQNIAWLPNTTTLDFRVRLPAPVDLVGPLGVVHANEAQLSWSPPDSSHLVEGYRVYRFGVVEQDVDATEAVVELLGGGADSFSVAARFDVGTGDATLPLEIDSAVVRLVHVEPTTLFQGDRVRLFMEGENLVFVQGEVDVGLGAGIEVGQPEVSNVDGLSVLVEVTDSAPTGMVDVRIRSGSLDAVLDGVIAVLDGAQKPALVRVHPESARQGETLEIQVDASSVFEDTPVADLGEGIIVQSLERVGESRVRLQVDVARNAPLGEHVVEVDDGVRIYGGVTFQVFDQAQPTTGCAISRRRPGTSVLVLLSLVAILLRRPSKKTPLVSSQR
jgi:hypothetical protein